MLVLTGRQAPAMLFEGVPLGEPVTKVTSTTYIDYLELMSACRNWVPLQKNCWMPNPEQVPPELRREWAHICAYPPHADHHMGNITTSVRCAIINVKDI